jgi:dinuclear metal center YbgI/SA1388 family protein
MNMRQIVAYLQKLAPLELAEAWDSVGLLIGDPDGQVERLMVCLTVMEATVDEAIAQGAQLIVTHHPLPFRPLPKIVCSDPAGQMVWKLCRHGISLYSPHTAWDNAPQGINQRIARRLELEAVCPMIPHPSNPSVGSGRCGLLPKALPGEDVLNLAASALPKAQLRWIGRRGHMIERIGIVCGSGGSLISAAASADCQLLITGEVTYHQALEASHLGIDLLLLGHGPSERFAMDELAGELAVQFPDLHAWSSRDEWDPFAQ